MFFAFAGPLPGLCGASGGGHSGRGPGRTRSNGSPGLRPARPSRFCSRRGRDGPTGRRGIFPEDGRPGPETAGNLPRNEGSPEDQNPGCPASTGPAHKSRRGTGFRRPRRRSSRRSGRRWHRCWCCPPEAGGYSRQTAGCCGSVPSPSPDTTGRRARQRNFP